MGVEFQPTRTERRKGPLRPCGLCFILAAIVTFVSPLTAAEPLKFRSRYYQIQTDLDKVLAKQVAEHMDLVFEEYTNRFRSFPAKNPGGHPLYVFATQQGYFELLEGHGIDGKGSGGMFFVNPMKGSGLATFLEEQGVERMLYTLRHEGFHQFAYNRIGTDLPMWVNEGLAEYYAGSFVAGRKLHAGQVSLDRLRALRAAIDEDKHLPLEKLLTMTGEEWGARVRSGAGAMQYAQSWSVVHFLVHGGPKYRQAFEQYLHMVARGTPSDQAFGRAFGAGSYEVFEKKWKQYMSELQPGAEATATHRLEFMGRGLGWLHENEQKVESVEQLKAELQKREFYIRYSTGHGEAFDMKATDDENFEPPPATRKGEESAIELVPSTDERLPPGLVVKGLKLPVRLTWQVDAEGKPVSRIVYE